MTVLQTLFLLTALALTSSGLAATNGGNDWLKPAREALNVARQTLQSFDPAQQIKQRLADVEAEMAACQSLLLEARTLGDDIRSARDNVLKVRLLGRGPDIWNVTLVNLQQAGTLPGTVQAFLLDRLQVKQLRTNSLIILGIVSALALALGLWWRRQWRQRLMHVAGEGIAADLSGSLQACLARRLPLILALAAATVVLLLVLPSEPLPPVVALLISMLVYLGGLTLSQALLNPCPPAASFFGIDPAYARALSRRIHGLLFLVLALILILSTVSLANCNSSGDRQLK